MLLLVLRKKLVERYKECIDLQGYYVEKWYNHCTQLPILKGTPYKNFDLLHDDHHLHLTWWPPFTSYIMTITYIYRGATYFWFCYSRPDINEGTQNKEITPKRYQKKPRDKNVKEESKLVFFFYIMKFNTWWWWCVIKPKTERSDSTRIITQQYSVLHSPLLFSESL